MVAAGGHLFTTCSLLLALLLICHSAYSASALLLPCFFCFSSLLVLCCLPTYCSCPSVPALLCSGSSTYCMSLPASVSVLIYICFSSTLFCFCSRSLNFVSCPVPLLMFFCSCSSHPTLPPFLCSGSGPASVQHSSASSCSFHLKFSILSTCIHV